jgi:hypothetical protein
MFMSSNWCLPIKIFNKNVLHTSRLPRRVLHALPISSSLIWAAYWHLVKHRITRYRHIQETSWGESVRHSYISDSNMSFPRTVRFLFTTRVINLVQRRTFLLCS